MFHTIILAGNVGRDPEMRYTPTGAATTGFSVACNRQYSNANGETVKETIWFRIQTWGKLAEICNQYLHKGSRVLIEGRLIPDKQSGNPRIWNKKDGEPAASFEVNAQTVRFLSPKADGSGAGQEFPAEDESQAPSPEDDIPF